MSAEELLDFVSRKGGTVLLYAEHQYYKVKQFKNDSEMWRCTSYKKLKCRGNIIFSVKDKNIVKTKGHTCSPDLSKNEVAKEIALLKDKVKESTRPVPELYERTVSKIKNKGLDIVTTVPAMSSIQHCLYDIRNRALCVNKTTFTNLEEVEVPSRFESFVLADYYYEGSRIIVFCSPSARQKVGGIHEFMGDGTFKCCPKPFYQLYSIHGDIGSTVETTNVMPLIFALLPNKSQATYNILFNLIKSALINFKPKKYHSDFERGAMNAIQEVYPEIEIRGCYYHWHKALWHQRKSLKLKSKGQTRIIGLTAALPLLPAEAMLDGYEYIKKEGCELNMKTFFKYIDKFWKKMYFSHILSVFGERHRTNNVMEGFHSKLNKKINKNTTILLRLLNVLFEINKLSSKRRKIDIENDDYITGIQMQFVSGEITVGEALEKLR